MFQDNTPQHSHNTRNRDTNRETASRVSGSKCIRYYMPSILDKTPNIITEKAETHSPKGFTNYTKKYYLSLYSDVCNITNCYICNS